MIRGGTIKRKVIKSSYVNYSPADYALAGQQFGDNLNPIKPSEMEEQYKEIVIKVRDKVAEAYGKAKLEPPEDIFQAEPTPSSLLNALNDLKNRLTKNPLQGLYDMGLGGSIPSLLSTNPELLNNPLGLDCEGVSNAYLDDDDWDDEEDDSDENEGEDGSDSEGSGGNGSSGNKDTTEYKITFVFDSTKASLDETELKVTKKDMPLILPKPTITGDFNFKGWYRDSAYATKVSGNTLKTITSDMTLYAWIVDAKEDSGDEGSGISGGTGGLVGLPADDCGLIELEFLKIILIIIQVVKILISVLITTYNIMKAASAIAFRAQLAWINPPAMQDLIGYIMQRLSAIIFQIVGMLLLKLWSLLNFDCISQNTQKVLGEINACLSGLSQLTKSIDSLALQLSGSGDLINQIKEAVKQLKDQVLQIYDEMKEQYSWKNIKKEFKESVDGFVEDYRELFSNPQLLYSEAVPQEIRDTILKDLQAVEKTRKQSLKTAKDLENTWKNLTGKKEEKKTKNTELTPVS